MSPYCNTFLSSSPDSLFNFATMKRTALLTGLALCLCVVASAQDSIDYRPQIHGTLRGKYEYQTQDNAGRFEVRTARVSVTGKVARQVDYKAEIDLCDEGQIKMLDAYARITPVKNFRFTIGQMRVPFTIDAHRSPNKQYFANHAYPAHNAYLSCLSYLAYLAYLAYLSYHAYHAYPAYPAYPASPPYNCLSSTKSLTITNKC